jgi:hypothetical protein
MPGLPGHRQAQYCSIHPARPLRDHKPRFITGHIDFLQARNGAIHILDYKPDARTNKPIAQLTVYSLALTRLVPGLGLFDIKCGWFNENCYNEFLPRLALPRPKSFHQIIREIHKEEAPTVSDFPVTRRIIERLDEWVMVLASPLLPLGEFPQELNGLKGFRWDFSEKTERALMVGKAVRMASGIRAALILADLGYVTECGTILRTVSDFVTEIISVYEGCTKDDPTRAQKDFLEQYFGNTAQTPDEYDEKQDKDRWVARDKLIAAHVRWASENKQDPARGQCAGAPAYRNRVRSAR